MIATSTPWPQMIAYGRSCLRYRFAYCGKQMIATSTPWPQMIAYGRSCLRYRFAYCGKHHPEVNHVEKTCTDPPAKELKLQETVTVENQQWAKMALLETKKWASQYQKMHEGVKVTGNSNSGKPAMS